MAASTLLRRAPASVPRVGAATSAPCVGSSRGCLRVGASALVRPRPCSLGRTGCRTRSCPAGVSFACQGWSVGAVRPGLW